MGTAHCTGFGKVQPQEEHSEARRHGAVRRKKPVGSRMGERNSCRGRERKLTLLFSPLQRRVTAQHQPPQLQPVLLFRHGTQPAPRRPPAQPGHKPAGGERRPTAERVLSATWHGSPEPPGRTQFCCSLMREATTKADRALNVLAEYAGRSENQKTTRFREPVCSLNTAVPSQNSRAQKPGQALRGPTATRAHPPPSLHHLLLL